MKIRTISIIVLIIVLSMSIGYSAFTTKITIENIEGIVRVEADIRVTGISVEPSSGNEISNYEEYDVKSISMEAYLPEEESTITYKVRITNFESPEMALFDIKGIPNNLDYEILNYDLKDKICDENNKCNLGMTKEIYIKIKYKTYDSSKLTHNINLDLVFVEYDLIETEFSYIGNYEEYIVPYTGTYKIEAWGAQGGAGGEYLGGKGGYTKGLIELQKNTRLYVYVGGSGYQNNTHTNIGGYNGGGYSGNNPSKGGYNGGGGGATDIRLVDGVWNNFASLMSRIMVAAGGGGGTVSEENYYTGGSGGGLTGSLGVGKYDGSNSQVETTAGTQIAGGDSIYASNSSLGTSNRKGLFGYAVQAHSYGYGGGGGSGYYAGATSWGRGGSGGSSFISGHAGCNAILASSTKSNIVHSGQDIHYSGNYFTDTVMIDGDGYKWTTKKGTYTGMPSQNGTEIITGNSGNGYAKITLIETN